jgi:hypothetical protein
MNLTKLDKYDYELLQGIIRIRLVGTNDPDLVDIMSEINRSMGRIYVEGRYYSYSDNYRIYSAHGESYIDLYVKELYVGV